MRPGEAIPDPVPGPADEPVLTGKALIDRKREELRERVSRRVKADELWGVEDLLPTGAVVMHIESGEVYRVVGHKHEGGDRGHSLKIQELDGTRVRHVRPWAVEEIDADEFDAAADEVEA